MPRKAEIRKLLYDFFASTPYHIASKEIARRIGVKPTKVFRSLLDEMEEKHHIYIGGGPGDIYCSRRYAFPMPGTSESVLPEDGNGTMEPQGKEPQDGV